MAQATEAKPGMKRAPMPGGNYVKMAVGMTCKGVMTEARMEVETKKDKKGKSTEKERYRFSLQLSEDTQFLVGKMKHEEKRVFKQGEVVVLPEHGFLSTTMRRTACEIAGVPYVPNQDTDLKPLVGKAFEITRLEDGEISSGEFAGKSSALYDILYGDPQA